MNFNQHSKRLLYVDDDRTVLATLRSLLSKSFSADDVELHEAASGEEGLAKVKELRPDIIISDIVMPGISGLEFCRQIRQLGGYSAVILMSAYDSEADNAVRAKDAGADAYLSKPIKKGELLFIVNFVLRVAQLNQSLYEKNTQLEQSLERLKSFHDRLGALNDELRIDKRRLDQSLGEMRQLNAQLEEKNFQISSMVAEVTGRFESTVALLANIIELRQSRHRGHSERVADISVAVARGLGASEHQVENIRIAARLHELGIVCLPEDEDKEVFRYEQGVRDQSRHPLIGEMLLKGLPGFEMVADILRHLHENVDGTGIPDRLSGERIPLGSRIVSAASYFDHRLMVMEEMKPHDVLALMERKGGSLFDEKVLGMLRDYVGGHDRYEKQNAYECTVFALQEGMELASDIYSESGINLLRHGTVLTKDMLTRVQKFHNVDPIIGMVRVKAK